MTNYCGNCEYYDTKQQELWGNRCYCVKTRKYREKDQKSCNLYIEKKKKDNGGCFITTIVCKKLGYEDNCDILETLRSLRENYLKKNEDGRTLLQEYDIIGPVISHEIDKRPVIVSIYLTKKYLIPCYILIKQGLFDLAVDLYKSMVNVLRYEFIDAIEKENPDYTLKTPIEDLGKARDRVKPARD